MLPLVWLNLGQALAHNKDVAAAERRASDLIAWLDSPGAPSNDQVLAGALRLRGKLRYSRDRNRDASLDFTRLLNLPASDRDLAEARILLSLSLEPRDRSTVCKLIHQAELDLAKLPARDDTLQTMFNALPKGCPKKI